MKPLKTLLGDVVFFEHPCFEDDRGAFRVLFQADAAEAAGLPSVFVQDNASWSRQVGTVRGLHLQLPPWEQGKLIRVTRGRVLDVFVDLRPGSSTHGQHESIELSAADDRQLWIPPGFAHGFCTLEPDSEIFYKVDAAYQPAFERTLAWNDPTLAIDWPTEEADAVLSDKDRQGDSLADIVLAIEQAAGDAATEPMTANKPMTEDDR